MIGTELYLVLRQKVVQLLLGNGDGFDALQHGIDEILQNGHGGLAVSYFLFMWMIGPFMSSVKPKGGFADKIFGRRLPRVY